MLIYHSKMILKGSLTTLYFYVSWSVMIFCLIFLHYKLEKVHLMPYL